MMSSVSLRCRVRSGVRKKFLTSCWVSVLPPWTLSDAKLSAARTPAGLAFARHVGVAEVAQFLLHVGLRNAQPDMQLERPGVDARRQREAAALELAAHASIEVQREHRRRERQRKRRPAEVSQAEVSQDLSAMQHRRILPSVGPRTICRQL